MNRWKVTATVSWVLLLGASFLAYSYFREYRELRVLVDHGRVLHIPKQMLSQWEETARRDLRTRASDDDLDAMTNILYNLNKDRPGQFQILFLRKRPGLSSGAFDTHNYSIDWTSERVTYDGEGGWIE